MVLSNHEGVWERCIRSARIILRAPLQEQTTDDEGLVTIMCEVESMLTRRFDYHHGLGRSKRFGIWNLELFELNEVRE